LFKKVLESQKAFAQRAGKWQGDTQVNYRMAYNHYFTAASKA
jgi:TRAP-type mannitol/chloroaromatic compound transport system substrate-binding protein